MCTAALSLRAADQQSSSRLGTGKSFLSGKQGEKLDWIVQASGKALLLDIFKDKLDKSCPEMVADPALGQGLNWMIYHSHFHPLVLFGLGVFLHCCFSL